MNVLDKRLKLAAQAANPLNMEFIDGLGSISIHYPSQRLRILQGNQCRRSVGTVRLLRPRTLGERAVLGAN